MEGEYFLNAQLHYQPNFEQYSQFESALSSMVSSPAASDHATDTNAIKELIGKLGNICNSGEITMISPEFTTYNSPNTSCYNTPMGSPPTQLHLPNINHFVRENLPNPMPMSSTLPILSSNPGFAERAAKFSCFGSKSFNGRVNQIGVNATTLLPRVSSSPSLIKETQSPMSLEVIKNFVGSYNEEASINEQHTSGENGLTPSKELNSRKRKVVSRGKAKEVALSQSANGKKEAEGDDTSNVKKSKLSGSGEKENGKRGKIEEDKKQGSHDKEKNSEPPKDYIHVRARRGQATDSHSLAERVRREKIGERMKLLQDLVPGCNKVTGKALMLDEIINYVQSLQRQVEFLSMKLATVNPEMDVNMNSLLSKHIMQPNGSLPNQYGQVSSSTSAYYGHQMSQVHKHVESLDATLHHNLAIHSNGFDQGLPQFPAFLDDDLQSIVQTSYAPNQTSHMKIEL